MLVALAKANFFIFYFSIYSLALIQHPTLYLSFFFSFFHFFQNYSMIFIFFFKEKFFSLCLHYSHTANLTSIHIATHAAKQRDQNPHPSPLRVEITVLVEQDMNENSYVKLKFFMLLNIQHLI